MPVIKVGDYLFTRLRQLGIKSVFGAPGDYELALLDLIRNRGLEWKGNPNELIASYAADGYAHINGAGAFVTTFGPGELSAYCGMAGQYCEFVLVAHVVGYPNVSAANSHAIMHHTLGTGEFDMYERMAKEITFATVVLRNKLTAAQDIDRALTTMMEQSCPVYIGVPMDIAYAPCSDEGLKAPLATALPANDKATEEKVVTTIRKMLEKATQPAIIVGGNTPRNNALKEAEALVKVTGPPYFVTAMGKGFNETLKNYGGVRGGGASNPEVKKYVESADVLLFVGRNDFNTGEFTVEVNGKGVIDFQRFG